MRYIDQFMAAFPFEGLTFDDISLVTQQEQGGCGSERQD